ncbi:MAG: DUF6526 family protein [Acidobacteriia bacterium]|nr:DUF6526 family protein [Terriglobia bacterium]
MSEQNFANHAKMVPAFHYFAMPVFTVNLGWAVHHLVKSGISFESVMRVLVAAALVVLFFCARLFALTVQDRVIRLEERLRYERLLPPICRGASANSRATSTCPCALPATASFPGWRARCLTKN